MSIFYLLINLLFLIKRVYGINILVENESKPIVLDCRTFDFISKNGKQITKFNDLNRSDVIQYEDGNLIIYNKFVSLINLKSEIYGKWTCESSKSSKIYNVLSTTKITIVSSPSFIVLKNTRSAVNKLYFNGIECELNSHCPMVFNEQNGFKIFNQRLHGFHDKYTFIDDYSAVQYSFYNELNTPKLIDVAKKSINSDELCNNKEVVSFIDENKICSLSNQKDCKGIGISFNSKEINFEKHGNFSFKCSTNQYERILRAYLGCKDGEYIDEKTQKCSSNSQENVIHLYTFLQIFLQIKESQDQLFIDGTECENFSCISFDFNVGIIDEKITIMSIKTFIEVKLIKQNKTLKFLIENSLIANKLPENFFCTNGDPAKQESINEIHIENCENNLYSFYLSKSLNRINIKTMKINGITDFLLSCHQNMDVGSMIYLDDQVLKSSLPTFITFASPFWTFSLEYLTYLGIVKCNNDYFEIITETNVYHKNIPIQEEFKFLIVDGVDSNDYCSNKNLDNCLTYGLFKKNSDLLIIENSMVFHYVPMHGKNVKSASILIALKYSLENVNSKTAYSLIGFNLNNCSNPAKNSKCNRINFKTMNFFQIKCPNSLAYQIIYYRKETEWLYLTKIESSDMKNLLEISVKKFVIKNNQYFYICLDKNDYFINYLFLGKTIENMLNVYENEGEILLKCTFLKEDFEIEHGSLERCNIKNLNQCSNNGQTEYSISNKIITIKLLKKLEESFNIRCFDRDNNIIFVITKGESSPKYDLKTLKINSFCTNEEFSFVYNNIECSFKTMVQKSCKNVADFQNNIINFHKYGHTLIKCKNPYYEISHKLIEDCKNGFKCAEICIELESKCDGINDCGTDELNCQNLHYINAFSMTQFKLKCSSYSNKTKISVVIKNKIHRTFDMVNLREFDGIKYQLIQSEIIMTVPSTSTEDPFNLHICESNNQKFINHLKNKNIFETIQIDQFTIFNLEVSKEDMVRFDQSDVCEILVNTCRTDKYELISKNCNSSSNKYCSYEFNILITTINPIIETFSNEHYNKYSIIREDTDFYTDSFYRYNDYCLIEQISILKNGQNCRNLANQTCNDFVVWPQYLNESIKFLYKSEVQVVCSKPNYKLTNKIIACQSTHIFCPKTNECELKKTIYDYFSCFHNNDQPLERYKFHTLKDFQVFFSCENINGFYKIREGLHTFEELPNYITKIDNKYHVTSIKSNVMFSCYGSVIRNFVMLPDNPKKLKGLTINVKEVCSSENLIIKETDDDKNMCKTLNDDCKKLSVQLIDHQLLFSYKKSYLITCLETYYTSYSIVDIECNPDDYHLCGNLLCLNKMKVCDGFQDCENDENNCTNIKSISQEEQNVYKLICPDTNEMTIHRIDKNLKKRIKIVEFTKKNFNEVIQRDSLKYFTKNNNIFIQTLKQMDTIDDHTCLANYKIIINQLIPNNIHIFKTLELSTDIYIKCQSKKQIFKNQSPFCNDDDNDNCVLYPHDEQIQMFLLLIEKVDGTNLIFECREQGSSYIYHIKKVADVIYDTIKINPSFFCEDFSKIKLIADGKYCFSQINRFECRGIFYKQNDEKKIIMLKHYEFLMQCTDDQFTLLKHVKFECPSEYYSCKGNKKCIEESWLSSLIKDCQENVDEFPSYKPTTIYISHPSTLSINCESIEGNVTFRISKKIICNPNCPSKYQRESKKLTITDFLRLDGSELICLSGHNYLMFKVVHVNTLSIVNTLEYSKYCNKDVVNIAIKYSTSGQLICYLLIDEMSSLNTTINTINNVEKCERMGITFNKTQSTVQLIKRKSYFMICNTRTYSSAISFEVICNSENVFTCKKKNLCLPLNKVCDGIDDCTNDELSCPNVIYIAAISKNVFKLPKLFDNFHLKRISNNKPLPIVDFQEKEVNGLIYLLDNGYVFIKKNNNEPIDNHLLIDSSIDSKVFILKFIEENIFIDVELSDDNIVNLNCQNELFFNSSPICNEKKIILTKIEENGDEVVDRCKFNNELININKLDDKIYEISFKIFEAPLSLGCQSNNFSKVYLFKKNNLKKLVPVDTNKVNYTNLCSSQLVIHYEKQQCTINEIVNAQNNESCSQYLLYDQKTKIITFKLAKSFKFISIQPDYLIISNFQSACPENYFTCPVTSVCLPSKNVHNLKLQCHPSIDFKEDIYHIKTMKTEKVSIICSDLSGDVDLLLGKYKICSSSQYSKFMTTSKVFTFLPEFMDITKYTCTNGQTFKSFYIESNEMIIKNKPVLETDEICSNDYEEIKIFNNNNLLCEYNKLNQHMNENLCNENFITNQQNNLHFMMSGLFLIQCKTPHFANMIPVTFDCSDSLYYNCYNKRCLLKHTIFSLKNQCDEDDLQIEETIIKTNGNDVIIICSNFEKKEDYNLFMGLMNICPINKKCSNEVLRKNPFTFLIPSDIIKIPYLRLLCSKTSYKDSDFSFTFQLIDTVIHNKFIITKSEIIDFIDKITDYNIFSINSPEICKNDMSFLQMCQSMGISFEDEAILFKNSILITFEFFTTLYFTKINYNIGCTSEDYYFCNNNKCLLKKEIFSLKKECEEEDLDIDNQVIKTNEEGVTLICSTEEMENYNLFMGLQKICSINQKCLEGIFRQNSFSFFITYDFITIPNIKFFCSKGEFTLSDLSFTFETTNTISLTKMSVTIEEIEAIVGKFIQYSIYLSGSADQCSNVTTFEENCKNIGVSFENQQIRFKKSAVFTFKIFTLHFITKIKYDFDCARSNEHVCSDNLCVTKKDLCNEVEDCYDDEIKCPAFIYRAIQNENINLYCPSNPEAKIEILHRNIYENLLTLNLHNQKITKYGIYINGSNNSFSISSSNIIQISIRCTTYYSRYYNISFEACPVKDESGVKTNLIYIIIGIVIFILFVVFIIFIIKRKRIKHKYQMEPMELALKNLTLNVIKPNIYGTMTLDNEFENEIVKHSSFEKFNEACNNKNFNDSGSENNKDENDENFKLDYAIDD